MIFRSNPVKKVLVLLLSCAKSINKNKFENHMLLCATCVFHQSLCHLIVHLITICKKYCCATIYSHANLDLIINYTKYVFTRLACSLVSFRACIASFVPYLYSLVVPASNLTIHRHSALLGSQYLYKFLLATRGASRYLYYFLIYTMKSTLSYFLNNVINTVVAKFIK